MGASVLSMSKLDAKAQSIVATMLRSCRRIDELVRNTLDFARGKLGGGIPVRKSVDGRLAKELEQVIAEIQSSNPKSRVEVTTRFDQSVYCDASRMAQLLGNLVGNAISHGSSDHPIQINVESSADGFEMSVANRGKPIPEYLMDKLFAPFTKAASDAPRPGLGLGLYIAAEIAKAHDGKLSVTSSESDGTKFVFRMQSRADNA